MILVFGLLLLIYCFLNDDGEGLVFIIMVCFKWVEILLGIYVVVFFWIVNGSKLLVFYWLYFLFLVIGILYMFLVWFKNMVDEIEICGIVEVLVRVEK